jgi:HlyD family secretion protein
MWMLEGLGMPPDPAVPALANQVAGIAAQWQAWQNRLRERSRFQQERIDGLRQRITDQEVLVRSLRNQLRLLTEEGQLIRRDYGRDSALALAGAVPAAELEASRAKVLRHAMNMEELRTRVAEVNIRKGEYQQELSKYLLEWERDHLLVVPADGRVSFTHDWASGQEISAGSILAYVLPDSAGGIMARISLATRGSGLVAPGARVRIRLDDFPALEYGLLEGIIVRVSAVPEESQLQVDARLTQGMLTTYGTRLPLRGALTGQAEVTTRSARLLERVVRP